VRSEPSKVLWKHENYLKKCKDLFLLSKRRSVSQSAFSLRPSTATPVFTGLNPVAATGPDRHPRRTEREACRGWASFPRAGSTRLPTLIFQTRTSRVKPPSYPRRLSADFQIVLLELVVEDGSLIAVNQGSDLGAFQRLAPPRKFRVSRGGLAKSDEELDSRHPFFQGSVADTGLQRTRMAGQ
jgi:hypothetical protein